MASAEQGPKRPLWAAAIAALLLMAQHLTSAAAATAQRPAGGGYWGSPGGGLASWLQTQLQSGLLPGFLSALTQLRSLPAQADRLLGRLQARRRDRGDSAAAARLEALRGWSSYVGLQRGVPALMMDVLRNWGVAAELLQDWSRLMERLQAGQPGAGLMSWPELVARERTAVLEWAKRSLRKAQRAFKVGLLASCIVQVQKESRERVGSALKCTDYFHCKHDTVCWSQQLRPTENGATNGNS
ncbi:hypothetical protein Agub_g9760 [Astrephomene gubernaculifera]|uniref:Uncharacterized protein n=1 Tax=Astrephomene gubernaculifera TaxID=47775 RepID=A0AAD3DY70_9CHLO|nr:hypothetical protein Agub_g9760 [Astrephomene gubernaculifera]